MINENKCHWCGCSGHDPDKCDWVTDAEVAAEKRGRAAHETPKARAAIAALRDARAIITDTIGFNFEPGELQTVNADDLLRLSAAFVGVVAGAASAIGGSL